MAARAVQNRALQNLHQLPGTAGPSPRSAAAAASRTTAPPHASSSAAVIVSCE